MRIPSFRDPIAVDTAIRPRVKNGQTERPDVDIIVVTNHSLATMNQKMSSICFTIL